MVVTFREQGEQDFEGLRGRGLVPCVGLLGRCPITELSRASPRDYTRLGCSKPLTDGDCF